MTQPNPNLAMELGGYELYYWLYILAVVNNIRLCQFEVSMV